jgi:hypothetical protein
MGQALIDIPPSNTHTIGHVMFGGGEINTAVFWTPYSADTVEGSVL